jgi:NDP-sugar pyrophosphorylase family protein
MIRSSNAKVAAPVQTKRRNSANPKRIEPLKAMILAAGLGTRLMPLTADKPKALVEVNGIPLLELALLTLSRNGFRDIIVNIHHHGQMIRDYLDNRQFPGVTVAISDETGKLLDTGGGILNARWFLEGDAPFLVYNVDIVTGIDLKLLREHHIQNGALATLAVSDRKSGRYFLFDRGNRLCGWENTATGITRWCVGPVQDVRRLAFSGIHVIDPKIFGFIQSRGKFSIVDTYLGLAVSHRIMAWDHTGQEWFDLGKPDQIGPAAQYLTNHPELLKP